MAIRILIKVSEGPNAGTFDDFLADVLSGRDLEISTPEGDNRFRLHQINKAKRFAIIQYLGTEAEWQEAQKRSGSTAEVDDNGYLFTDVWVG